MRLRAHARWWRGATAGYEELSPEGCDIAGGSGPALPVSHWPDGATKHLCRAILALKGAAFDHPDMS